MPGALLQALAGRIASPAQRRASIDRLEAEMRDMPQLDIKTTHTFGPGFYVRSIAAPAGAVIVGKVHATEHVFALTKGTLLIVTEDGEAEISAPFQQVCRHGLKRAGVAITDIECSNLHITTETDLVKLEEMLIEPPQLLEGSAA